MSKVTSKLQVTIPKAIAQAHGIRPGTNLTFESAGRTIRLRVEGEAPEKAAMEDEREWRLKLFDEATRRQSKRNRTLGRSLERSPKERGWHREDLYDRGLPR